MADDSAFEFDRRTVLKAGGGLAASVGLGSAAVGTATADEGGSLSLDLPVMPLEMGHYEGWAIFGSEKVSTGTFGAEDSLTFDVDRDLTEADRIVVTIEPEGDGDDTPSGIVYAAGELTGTSAALSFPVDFPEDLSGTYILATPTDGGGSNETSGVWFIDPRGGPSAGLADLPDLPTGWVYEGWVVSGGRPLSTGRFSDPAGRDDFDGFSGSGEGPPFPGEDFLTNAPEGVDFPLDLANGMSKVVVSVEPDLDGVDPTGPAPFSIKPLVADVPADLDDHTPAELTGNLGTVPEGTAHLMPAARSVGDYAGADGEVDDGELRDAIVDWSSDEIDDGLLRDVIVSWSSS